MKWCECPYCGHKLFKYSPEHCGKAELNIKCSSCKRIWTLCIVDGHCGFFDENGDMV